MVGEVMEQKDNKTKGIQSVERAFFILDKMKNYSEGVTLTELSDITDISKSNLQKYLTSFVNLDILQLDNKTKIYTFSLKLIDLGLSALRKKDIMAISDSYMNQIKNELNHSSMLALWSNEGPIIVKYQGSGKSINVEIEVGYRPPLLVSSVGKCFAAYLPHDKIEELYRYDIDSKKLDPKAIEKQLQEVRTKGFAYRETQFGDLPGNHTIACPIFNYNNEIIGVIGMIGFSHDLNLSADGNEVKLLKKIAHQMSSELVH